MGGAKRRSIAMPLPMQVSARERASFERVFAAIENRGSQELRDEASVMRLQLDRHARYVNACAKLEAHGDALRESGASLVPLRLPMRLTEGTRESVKTGAYRSFLRFVQDLHESVLTEHGGSMDDACTDVPAFLEKMAGALTLETCRVLDGCVGHKAAVQVVVRHAERCRVAAVREESKTLDNLGRACEAVVLILRDFGRKMSGRAKSVATHMRAWLKAADRKGLRSAGAVLLAAVNLREGLVDHECWLSSDARQDDADDAKLVRLCALLCETHCALAEDLTWQARRARQLVTTTSANACWCGLTLSCDVLGTLVQAPAHMRSFATGKRVRLVRAEEGAPFLCRLSAACVSNALVRLLADGHLVLNRFSTGYTTRIVTSDFVKYEKMARHLLDDHVRPWAKRIGDSLVQPV